MYGEYLEDQAKEWLKMGIVLPTRNWYNSLNNNSRRD
jgi:hypothetical protein